MLRCDHQPDERGVAGRLLEEGNVLGERPHTFESLKGLVDRHPQALQRDEGPPHPPWPLRKGLAAAEGRVESRKPTPACERTAGRQTAPCWTRGGERDGEGAAGDMVPATGVFLSGDKDAPVTNSYGLRGIQTMASGEQDDGDLKMVPPDGGARPAEPVVSLLAGSGGKHGKSCRITNARRRTKPSGGGNQRRLSRR